MTPVVKTKQAIVKLTHSVIFHSPLPAKHGFVNFGIKNAMTQNLLNFYHNVSKTSVYIMAKGS